MRDLIWIVALLASGGVLKSSAAEAAPILPRLQAYMNQSVISVHCRRTYHCRWDSDAKVKRCHVCG